MTHEQELFWNILKSDPYWFAHEQGAQLAQLDEADLHVAVDNLMLQMSNSLSTEAICSVLKTWLSVYKLPLDAHQLDAGFEQIHAKIGPYLLGNFQRITPV